MMLTSGDQPERRGPLRGTGHRRLPDEARSSSRSFWSHRCWRWGSSRRRTRTRRRRLARASRRALRPLRILLAEDSLVNQKLAVALLETHGHQVTVVGNGREAVAAAGIAALRRGADGRADAGDGRAGGHGGDPRQGAGSRRPRPDRRHDGPCPEGRSRALPGGRHGRIRGQADPRRAGSSPPSKPSSRKAGRAAAARRARCPREAASTGPKPSGRAGQSSLAGHDRGSRPGRDSPPDRLDRRGRGQPESDRFAPGGAHAQGVVALLRRGGGRAASPSLGTNGAPRRFSRRGRCPADTRCPAQEVVRYLFANTRRRFELTSSLEPTEMRGGSIGRWSARSAWS